jgi:hypothetical protein
MMRVASCPAALDAKNPVKSLVVTSVYGSNFAIGWVGGPINWEGQQAWLTVEPAYSGRMSAHATLTLPWLNTQVSASAADEVAARALLDNVHVHPATSLEVPTSADTVTINWFNHLPPAKHANQDFIKMLLTDLRRLPIETPSAVCGEVLKSGKPWYITVTFTKSGTDTTFMIPRQGCQQLTSGTGVVVRGLGQFDLDFGQINPGGPAYPTSASLRGAETPAPPKNAFHFDNTSYMYPPAAGTTAKFTPKQLGAQLHGLTVWNGMTTAPHTYLVMAAGPFTGRNGKPALMWVVRYTGVQIPNYGPGCGFLKGSALARCQADGPPSRADLYAFYDATTGVRYSSAGGYSALQSLTFTSKPGWPAIDQWVAKYLPSVS